jgi:tetratricopeptide (TPR) repeat protein
MSATAALRPRPADPGRRPARASAMGVVPGFVAFAVALVLAPFDGGFPSHTWYPAALFLLAVLALVLGLAPPAPWERPRAVMLPLYAYGAFCAWSYLSILWAGSQGDAWDGANRTLLYGAVLMLVGMRPWPRRAVAGLLALVAGAVAAIALGVLVVSAARNDPAGLFVQGRLSSPAGYPNATTDLWLIAFWPAFHLAVSATLPRAARAVFAGAAVLLLETSVLALSRGAVLGMVVAAVVYLALSRVAARAALAMLGMAVLAALSWGALTGPHDARTAAAIGPALSDARLAIALSVGAAVAGALAAMALAPRFAQRLRTPKPSRRTVRVAAGGVAAAAVAALAVAIGTGWVTDRWDDFKYSGYERVGGKPTQYVGSLGSNRYDFYRVALKEFADHPVLGIGADNFAAAYLEHRRTPEAPRYPHSIVLRVLSQLGIVGALAFAAFLWLALRACGRALRRAGPIEAGLATAALGGFVVWLVQGSFDWLWEFPTLGILGTGLLALAVRTVVPVTPPPPPDASEALLDSPYDDAARRGGFHWSPPARFAAGVAGLAAALSLALPGISARYTDAAYHDFRDDPGLALSRLNRAADLNPLSAEPLLARGVVAQRLGLAATARSSFQRAAGREPDNWFAQFELGVLDAAAGRRASAVAHIAKARRLNPQQMIVQVVDPQVRQGRPIDVATIERGLYGQLNLKVSATERR